MFDGYLWVLPNDIEMGDEKDLQKLRLIVFLAEEWICAPFQLGSLVGHLAFCTFCDFRAMKKINNVIRQGFFLHAWQICVKLSTQQNFLDQNVVKVTKHAQDFLGADRQTDS